MEDLDKPENGAWLRSIIAKVKGIQRQHKQIDDLAEELGTAITGDPDHLKKLDAIGKLQKDYNIYS